MPSKIQLDENLWFLYICLQKSDYKAIDFNAVGDATKLKPPAARMRYTRLRRAIEGGTLIGTHGTPFQGGAEKGSEVGKKRKVLLHRGQTDEIDDLEAPVTRSGSCIIGMEKVEDGLEDLYDTGLSTDGEKAPSVRRRAWARKRKVDADDEKPELTSALLRLGERKSDSGPHNLSLSAKVERRDDLDSKDNLAGEGQRPTGNGGRAQTGARSCELPPPNIQQPVQAFRSGCEKGLTLKTETDGTLSTGATTTQTRLLLKVEDKEIE